MSFDTDTTASNTVFRGVVQGNAVLLDGYDMSRYEGTVAYVTLKYGDDESDRMAAFNDLLEFVKTVPSGIDSDTEIEGALWEKYEC